MPQWPNIERKDDIFALDDDHLVSIKQAQYLLAKSQPIISKYVEKKLLNKVYRETRVYFRAKDIKHVYNLLKELQDLRQVLG